MNFELTEEHIMIRDAARDFAQNELLPGVIQRDEEQAFPTEQVKKMAELGFMGMMVSPEYGGGGMDTISYVLAMEEISKVDASVNNSLVCWGIETYGSKEQKDKYLKRLATGEIIGAFCLSEPEAGSDATSQRTTAIDNGDHYILNGTKNWITNGNSASVYLVIAQTDHSLGHKGINAFIVEKDTLGNIIKRKVTVEENLNRRNYSKSDNINYLDGDYDSKVNAPASDWLQDSDEYTTNQVYELNKTSLISDQTRVYKGGSYKDRAYWMVPGTRRFLDQKQSTSYIGFRCAMDRLGPPTSNLKENRRRPVDWNKNNGYYDKK